jgi:hypothetical protein
MTWIMRSEKLNKKQKKKILTLIQNQPNVEWWNWEKNK